MTAWKKVFATALALSLPLSALAQTPAAEPAKPAEAAPASAAAPAAKAVAPLATLYGTLNVNLQTTKAYGATAGGAANVESRNALSTDSTNIGVRGTLNVNEWLGVTYQCETSAAVDGIGAAGLCGRNSRLGLTGAWGTLFYGNWDTPYKAATYGTKADDPFQNTDVFGFQSLMSSPGFNARSGSSSIASNTSITGFDLRGNNSVAFHSPKWNGLSAKLQYGANEFKNATGTQNPELYSAAVNFDYGPFSVVVSSEMHNDGFALVGINPAPPVTVPPTPGSFAFGATAGNTAGTAASARSEKDTAWKAAAGYQLDSPIGATTVSGIYEQLVLKQDKAAAGAVKEYKRNAWTVALKHRFGDEELRARYTLADKGDVTLNGAGGSTSGYGASELILGYAHHFSKSLQGYVSYAKIKNARNAQYTFTIGGSPAVAGTTVKGADPQALGLGLRYAF